MCIRDRRYESMVGVPGVRIEGGFAAHKAPPGRYTVILKMGGQTVTTDAEILPNPLYPTDASTYTQYHQTMLAMETELTAMHRMVNSLYEKQKQLESLLGSLPPGEKYTAIKKDGEALLKNCLLYTSPSPRDS